MGYSEEFVAALVTQSRMVVKAHYADCCFPADCLHDLGGAHVAETTAEYDSDYTLSHQFLADFDSLNVVVRGDGRQFYLWRCDSGPMGPGIYAWGQKDKRSPQSLM